MWKENFRCGLYPNVIVSRVKFLNQLFFVGDKTETLDAIRSILRRRSLPEERLYSLFCSLKRSSVEKVGPTEIETPSYLRHHFEVPTTPNGFVYVLVSTKRNVHRLYYISECENLSEELRMINSTSTANNKYIYSNQPWSVGFFYWNFTDENERKEVLYKLSTIFTTEASVFEDMKEKCQQKLLDKQHLKLCICGRTISLPVQ